MAKRKSESRVTTDGFKTQLVSDGQPRGISGPADMELDGNVLGTKSGFRYATGREKQIGDWGLAQLNGRGRQS